MDAFETWARKDLESRGVDPDTAAQVVENTYGATAMGRPVTDPDMLYITDNGATYCGDDLGASAKYTGRDISGQPILPVSPMVVAEARADGWEPVCEACGKGVRA